MGVAAPRAVGPWMTDGCSHSVRCKAEVLLQTHGDVYRPWARFVVYIHSHLEGAPSTSTGGPYWHDPPN